MKHKKSEHTVSHIKVQEKQNINELVKEFEKSGVFGPGRVAEAVNIYYEMLKEKATVFLGLAGALVPGGMKQVIVDMIREDMVHVLVSTGANMTHDLVEAFGGKHVREIKYSTDKELRDKGIDRIYDAFIEDQSFMIFEDHIQPIFEDIWEEKKNEKGLLAISTSELLKEIGKRVESTNSIVRAAYEKDVPIFVPALSDSILGLQLWLFSQTHKVLIDDMGDLGHIQKIAWDVEKAGAFFLGGGVPKNYIFQSRLMSPKTFDYAIQITMDRVETGGLSGASLSEAISWGKVDQKSKMVTVVGDVTLVLPLIYGATLERIKQNKT